MPPAPEETKPLLPVPPIAWGRVVGMRRALFGNQLQNMVRLGRAAGDIGVFRAGETSIVIINAPALVDDVLVKQASCFSVARTEGQVYRHLVKNGLPHSNGEFHRRQRKILAPPLQPGSLARHAANIAAGAEQMQAMWQGGQVVDIVDAMQRLTMACHWRTFLGLAVPPEGDALSDSFLAVMQCLDERARLNPLRRALPAKARAGRLREAVTTLSASVNALIAQNRTSGKGGSESVLSALLLARDEDGNGMEDAQVHDELLAMLLAGYETVASAITWALLLLSQHPACRTHLHQELDTVLQGRTPTFDDLPRLPYALQVLKETMRLYPTGGNIIRRADTDVQIGGYALASGTEVWVMPFLMNRAPNAFPDPERFDPERFAPDTAKDIPRYAFMPFGGGAHYCIGHHLALMQNHLLLAALTQRVSLTVLPRPRVEPEMLTALWPKRGMQGRVTRRAAAQTCVIITGSHPVPA